MNTPSIKLCECGCGLPTKISNYTSRLNGWVKGKPRRFIQGHHSRVMTTGTRFEAGRTPYNLNHGMAGTPEFMAFCGAKQRCTNPGATQFEDYGGRGIKFLFESFEQFFTVLGRRPRGMTLDRINNDGHYEPSNVRWATRSQQNANQRKRKKAA